MHLSVIDRRLSGRVEVGVEVVCQERWRLVLGESVLSEYNVKSLFQGELRNVV